VGILYNFAKTTADRNLLMNSIAPIGTATRPGWCSAAWVVGCFPPGFAIILPAVYFPILIMLLALIFRGVAFEFRFRDVEHRTFWDHAFGYGSAIATFAQGVVLGAFIQGFQVEAGISWAAVLTASHRSLCSPAWLCCRVMACWAPAG